MAEYIEWEALHDKAIGTDAYFQIKSIVTGLPAADVAPVRHGRWEPPVAGIGCLCSICKAQSDNDYRFCPHCGARMDEEGNHVKA